MRAILRHALYPVFFFGGATAIVWGLVKGVSYAELGPAVLIASAAIVAALERWWPHTRAWQRDHGDLRTDSAHLAANVAVSQLSIGAFTFARGWMGPALDLWPGKWPFVAQFFLATASIDFGLYVVHRASHGVGALWRLHAIHHSSTRLYWLNGQRRHFLHELLEGAPGLLVLLVLGASPVLYAAAIATITLHLIWQHANIDYRGGPLRYVFAVAELHRWHHQRKWQAVQGNYGALLSLWDYAFRTALRKSEDAPDDVGMDDEQVPPGFLAQLRWPFARALQQGPAG